MGGPYSPFGGVNFDNDPTIQHMAARIAALEAALKPFADLADLVNDYMLRDGVFLWVVSSNNPEKRDRGIRAKHIIEARAALKGGE